MAATINASVKPWCALAEARGSLLQLSQLRVASSISGLSSSPALAARHFAKSAAVLLVRRKQVAAQIAPILSTQAEPVLHQVKEGECLSSIAELHGTTIDALASANRITDPDLIFEGDLLHIPPASRTTATAPLGLGMGTTRMVVLDGKMLEIGLQPSFHRYHAPVSPRTDARSTGVVVVVRSAARPRLLKDVAAPRQVVGQRTAIQQHAQVLHLPRSPNRSLLFLPKVQLLVALLLVSMVGPAVVKGLRIGLHWLLTQTPLGALLRRGRDASWLRSSSRADGEGQGRAGAQSMGGDGRREGKMSVKEFARRVVCDDRLDTFYGDPDAPDNSQVQSRLTGEEPPPLDEAAAARSLVEYANFLKRARLKKQGEGDRWQGTASGNGSVVEQLRNAALFGSEAQQREGAQAEEPSGASPGS